MADEGDENENPGFCLPEWEMFYIGKEKGQRIQVFLYEGMYLFPLPEPFLKGERQIDKLRAIKNTELQDDDIIICAFPKCGTHWLWEILEMLKSGLNKHQKEVKETRMLEVIFKEGIEAMPSPRIFNTHLALRMLPRQVEEKKIKCIHIIRNPKDTCVSWFNHLKAANLPDSMEWDFAKFTHMYLSGKLYYGAYYQYLLDWDKEVAQTRDLPTMSLCYENMKRDPSKYVKELADFLGVAVRDRFCEEVAEACSFQKMKKADETKEGTLVEFWKEGSGGTMYRKGEVGDWKNWFTVAESERFDEIWNEKMKNSGITCTYSL